MTTPTKQLAQDFPGLTDETDLAVVTAGAKGYEVDLATARICDCGALASINAVGLANIGTRMRVIDAAVGNRVNVADGGRRPGHYATRIQGPLPEFWVHPGWDAGTSTRETCCDLCIDD